MLGAICSCPSESHYPRLVTVSLALAQIRWEFWWQPAPSPGPHYGQDTGSSAAWFRTSRQGWSAEQVGTSRRRGAVQIQRAPVTLPPAQRQSRSGTGVALWRLVSQVDRPSRSEATQPLASADAPNLPHGFSAGTKKAALGSFSRSTLLRKGGTCMAQRTGLEPATPGVTGRYSNRLNYRCASAGLSSVVSQRLVADDGIEPPTPCV